MSLLGYITDQLYEAVCNSGYGRRPNHVLMSAKTKKRILDYMSKYVIAKPNDCKNSELMGCKVVEADVVGVQFVYLNQIDIHTPEEEEE